MAESSEAVPPPPIRGDIRGIPVEAAGPGDHELGKILGYL